MSRRRLLLVAVVLVGIGLLVGVFNRRAGPRGPDPAAATVAAVERLGGRAERDADAPGGPVVRVRLGRKHITDADVEPLGALADLEEVRLQGTSVTDAGLRHLRPLRRLRTLDLRGTPITDAGLAEVANFPDLEVLVLFETAITDAGLEHLRTLRHLKVLEVPPACLTPRGFRVFADLGLIAGFPGLRTIGDVQATSPQDVHAVVVPPLSLTADSLATWEAEFPALRVFRVRPLLVTDELVRAAARQGRLHKLRVVTQGSAGFGVVAPEVLEAAERDRPRRDEDLTDLWLNECPVSDASLDVLLALKSLRSLGLNHTRLTGAGIARLAALPNLTDLWALGIRLTAADLQPFRNRPGLTVRADFDRSDAGLKAYREAGVLPLVCDSEELPGPGGKFIRTLDLSGTPVTDVGLAVLAGQPGIECLDLGDTAVTDDGLRHLGGLGDLVDLRLNGTAVTDVGLRSLASMPRLRSLDLAGTRVTDAGLRHLHPLKGLRELNLAGTGTTAVGRRALRRALPDLELGPCRTRLPR